MRSARPSSRQSRMSGVRYGALGLSAVAGAVPLHLLAQAQRPSDVSLEEIFVTARRVQENLQDTPIAVSAFTADALEERQIFRDRRSGSDHAESAVQ